MCLLLPASQRVARYREHLRVRRSSMDNSATKVRWRQRATHREYRAHRRSDFRAATDTTALANRRTFR